MERIVKANGIFVGSAVALGLVVACASDDRTDVLDDGSSASGSGGSESTTAGTGGTGDGGSESTTAGTGGTEMTTAGTGGGTGGGGPPVIDPGPVENFDAMPLGGVPSSFTSVVAATVVEPAGGAASGSNAVQLIDDQGATEEATSANARLTFAQPAMTGVISASMYFPAETTLTRYLTVFHGGSTSSANRLVDLIVGSAGDVKRRFAENPTTGDTELDPPVTLTADTWIDVEVAWDVAAGSYWFTVDGVVNGPFDILSTEPASNMEFKAGSSDAEFDGPALLIDDVSLATE